MNAGNRIINWFLDRIYIDVGSVTNLVVSLDADKNGKVTVAELVTAILNSIGR